MSEQFLNFVENGDLLKIKKNILNIDLNTKNEALLKASENGNLEVVKFLVENETNIRAYNDFSIKLASTNGHTEIVKFLVENGANIHSDNDYSIRIASENGHLNIVKYLIKKGANIHAKDDEALRRASRNGHLNVVEYLVNSGANVNAEDDKALRWASEYGHLDVVQFLVTSGANIHASNDEALRRASVKGHLNVVKYLIKKGANINASNDEALRWASVNGHLNIVEFLVNSGANIHAKDDEALEWASSRGHYQVVKYLIKHGANVNILHINKIRIAPPTECSEEIIQNPNFIHICNSGNNVDETESSSYSKLPFISYFYGTSTNTDYLEIDGKNPIDPIMYEPIPLNLLISVKAISDTQYKNSTCFNAESLYTYWLEQAKSEAGVSYKYAANPLTRGYFNQESVNFVIKILIKLNKF